MILYVNSNDEIKDVNTTKDPTLRAFEIVEDSNPFIGWSIAKICCYKVRLRPEKIVVVTKTETITYTNDEGEKITENRDITETVETGKYLIRMMIPYVDAHLIEHIDALGQLTEQADSHSSENGLGLVELAELFDENVLAILDMAEYVASLEERIKELEKTKEV